MGAIPEELASIEYREDFLKQNLSGKATVRLDIDETGTVTGAVLLKFTDDKGNIYDADDDTEPWLNSLGQSLVEAALKSKFNPALICGETVPVQQLFTFDIDPDRD